MKRGVLDNGLGNIATKHRVLLTLLMALASISLTCCQAAVGEPMTIPQSNFGLSVRLQAASGGTISFTTNNGQTVDDIKPQTTYVPYLVLLRNGQLTPREERTLSVTVSGIEVPPPGVTVTLQMETQHGDPDLGGDIAHRINVWRESRWIANNSQATLNGQTAVFHHQFGKEITLAGETSPMPTDYFRLQVTISQDQLSAAAPLVSLQREYAFLLENQWFSPLPQVYEETPGAAPDELAVYYYDMTSFQKGGRGAASRPRRQVSEFVGSALVPRLIAAYRQQSHAWGFTWYEAWTSYRTGADSERLSVALTDEQTWFHGPAPVGGDAQISLSLQAYEYTYYDTLTDALVATFHHELFHNLQRNLSQHYGGLDQVAGVDDAWLLFTEGTAVVAPTIADPAAQFAPDSAGRFYLAEANAFLGDGGLFTGFNTSYLRQRPYRSALYWRFLYEQCGGLDPGAKNPAAGLEIIKQALTILYGGDQVDIMTSQDLIGHLPAIMDRALAQTPGCPFTNYQESLTLFSRAIYGLRLAGGRCDQPGRPVGCHFYDPYRQYEDPPVDTISYAGGRLLHASREQLYPAGIGSSFGFDFVDILLDPAARGHSLSLEFSGAPGATAQFHVQAWRLAASANGEELLPLAGPEILTETNADGHQVYALSAADLSQTECLGLIITRLDANESADPIGEYAITLNSD